MNDPVGISIYDHNWNFIQRINSSNPNILLSGNMLIFDDFIYISNALASSHYILKLDLDLHLINYLSVNVNFFSIAYDSCNNRLLGLWKSEDTNGIPVIGINIYNLNLRKLSEMNTTTINNNVKNLIGSSLELFFFMNKLYISAWKQQ